MQDDTTLNFLPDDYVTARNRARANRLCGALLGIVILGVASAFAFAEASLHHLRDEHASIAGEFQREAARLQRLDELQQQQSSVTRRATMAEALIEHTTRTALIGELSRLLPDGASIAELTMASRVREHVKTAEELLAERNAGGAKPAPAAPEPKRYDVSMHLAGLAYTDVQVAVFINRLARSPYFDDVNLLVSREFSRGGSVVRRFEVDFTVRPEPLLPLPGNDAVVSTEALNVP